jgi:predicted secreted Zn-dependent protease
MVFTNDTGSYSRPFLRCVQRMKRTVSVIKMIGAVIALVLLAGPVSFACEDPIEVAYLDRNATRPRQAKTLVPAVTEKYEYYDIRGKSEQELQCQISKNGCTWTDGKKYDAMTRWRVRWNYGYNRTEQACSATSFRATVEIVFRFPRWVTTEHAPVDLVEKWQQYLDHLMSHEKGHRDMAVEAVDELNRAVAELPPAENCSDIDRSVSSLYRKQMARLQADQNLYDTRTVHGRTQGAVFP